MEDMKKGWPDKSVRWKSMKRIAIGIANPDEEKTAYFAPAGRGEF
jgi:hypothetical protein